MARKAFISGAASGIGLAVAHRLAKNGISLILADRAESVMDLAQAFRDSGHEAEGHVVDMTDETAVDTLLQGLLRSHGAIDILVNSAGIHPKKDGVKFALEEIGMAGWRRVMDLNINATFQTCATLLPAMKAKGWGRVVNIGSAASRTRPGISSAHYVASKAAVNGLTRVVAEEGAKFGVTANTVSPGPIRTALTNSNSPAQIERMTANIAMGRFGEADEVAAVVAFLTSDDASFVTGTNIDVNGGSVML